MSQLGRIGGGLLAPNLERQGVNLSFKNLITDDPLLFLEVSAPRQVGINTDILPEGRSLIIDTKIKTDNLITNSLSVPNYVIDQNRLQIDSGDILLDSDELIVASGIATDNLTIQNNLIVSQDSNIVIVPSINETVSIHGDFRVFENLFNTQDIILGGSLIFGDSSTDAVSFNSKIFSSLIPLDDQKTIGTADFFWKNGYVHTSNLENVFANNIHSPTATVAQIQISNNVITVIDSSSDLILSAHTGGSVVLDTVSFSSNTISNFANQNLVLESSTNGYIKFDITSGIVLPVISTNNLPVSAQTGETVYNPQSNKIEIWNGVNWIPGSGELPELSMNEIEDYITEWTLILD